MRVARTTHRLHQRLAAIRRHRLKYKWRVEVAAEQRREARLRVAETTRRCRQRLAAIHRHKRKRQPLQEQPHVEAAAEERRELQRRVVAEATHRLRKRLLNA